MNVILRLTTADWLALFDSPKPLKAVYACQVCEGCWKRYSSAPVTNWHTQTQTHSLVLKMVNGTLSQITLTQRKQGGHSACNHLKITHILKHLSAELWCMRGPVCIHSVSTETWPPVTSSCQRTTLWRSVILGWPETFTKTPTTSGKATYVTTLASRERIHFLIVIISFYPPT